MTRTTDDATEELTTDDVEAALREVRDPRQDIDVFDAGLVEDVTVADGAVTVEAVLTEFDGDASQVTQAMLAAVRDVDGVESAHVEPVAPSAEGRGSAGEFEHVVAVASAKGGVGKSTVATTLACGLAAEDSVGLFDADVHGPNVPTLLDLEGPIHSTQEGHPLPVDVPAEAGEGSLQAMSVGLMESGAPLAWRGAMVHDAVSELFADTAWDAEDALVVDMPPGTGDVVLTTLQEVPVDGVVVVTTPFHAAVDDTARTVELFRDNDVPVLGVVVNMATRTCPSCGDEHDMFPGQDALDELDAPVLAELPFDPGLQAGPTPGVEVDAAAGLVDAVRDAIATAGEVQVPDDAVDLRRLGPEARKESVREGFAALDAGDPFVVVSDRDPSPVRNYLADLAGVPVADFPECDVRRATPDAWVLETTHP